MIDLIFILLALFTPPPPANHCKKGDGGVCGS
jgi:hypothetical protein